MLLEQLEELVLRDCWRNLDLLLEPELTDSLLELGDVSAVGAIARRCSRRTTRLSTSSRRSATLSRAASRPLKRTILPA